MCINSIYTFSLTDFIFMGFVMRECLSLPVCCIMGFFYLREVLIYFIHADQKLINVFLFNNVLLIFSFSSYFVKNY